ncbi:hypothetical protein [Streptomyces sp. NPDC004721]
MPESVQPTFCSYQPVPGEFLSAACVECGHALVLHIGVEHCPVCEMVHLNQQTQEAAVTFEQVARGEKTINDYREARGLPPFPEPEVVVQVEGTTLDDAALRRAVEKQMQRGGFSRT